jgi:hypothetical protein
MLATVRGAMQTIIVMTIHHSTITVGILQYHVRVGRVQVARDGARCVMAQHLGGEGEGVDGELLSEDEKDEPVEGAGGSRAAEAGVEQAQRVNGDGGDGAGEREDDGDAGLNCWS